MSKAIGKTERATQDRVIELFKNELGYTYLGNWEERSGNSNIEVGLLESYLQRAGYQKEQISAAILKLQNEAGNPNRRLYQNNKEVYGLLRYGQSVKTDVSRPSETVNFIDWKNPLANDFAIAEEVTLHGNNERRPDLVLYVNGIAIAVIELKNSRVGIDDGVRQLLSNQDPAFNEWFFSTTQILFAGNDTEGLKYGTIKTPEKFYLTWKEDEEDNTRYKLDKYLLKMCEKKRLIELMYDFVLFDGGIKKLPRVHQYFGVKAAQDFVRRKEGGIIWHTQGSGKSIVMVMLAKWILENNANARVVIITDRSELDEQISERVFKPAGEEIYRTKSGRDLMSKLSSPTPRLLCSLVHKFSQRDVENWDEFIKEIKTQPTKTVGELFVFVDECHRTQSGKLHEAMVALMPSAVFVGFTGTPLLKKDKATSLEIFGKYIHTYKFSEAVEDKVVLDLVYEARDIDQKLGSEDKIDAWFEAKTKGLNDWQKEELQKQWATMQKVMSSRSRMEKVVADIVFDFSTKPRLSSSKGNAILVASSIFEACKYFQIFQKTVFKGKCGIVTSYNLDKRDTTLEETGANTETDRQFIYNTYSEIVENVSAEPGLTAAETYEKNVKKLFIEEPANMKLLVVVSKLLTGFDAPSCTYLYIDKSMEDHGLFQAICRTNRLDGDDKDYGFVVDYKDLFKKVEKVISVYSSEIDTSSGGADSEVLMKSRIDKARENLEEARDAMFHIWEPIEQPKGELECIHYFCGNTEIATDLEQKRPLRIALYKAVANFARGYANLADEMEAAGYSKQEISTIKEDLKKATDLRATIRRASGEELDLKPFEADMRHLIDTYIEAADPRKISSFEHVPLIDLIVKSGIADAIAKKFGSNKPQKQTAAAAVENNLRSKITSDMHSNPEFYSKMSKLLDEVIKFRKENAKNYEEYLKKIEELARKVKAGADESTPESLKTPGLKALYANLGKNEEISLKIDSKVKNVRPADWRGNLAKESVIKSALYDILNDENEVEHIFAIIKEHREY